MLRKKGAIAAVCLVLGIVIFATTAFADVMLGSGYSNMKEATKTTFTKLFNNLDSFTLDGEIKVKGDGDEIFATKNHTMVDVKNRSIFTENFELNYNGLSASGMNYSDKNKSIIYNSNDDSYTVVNYEDQNIGGILERGLSMNNPFESEYYPDIERIVDAAVGSYADLITVSQNKDGGKVFTGEMNESQIPPLANAILSFGLKQSMFNEYDYGYTPMGAHEFPLPRLTDDIYIGTCSFIANQNKDGIIDSLTFEGNLLGKDKDGIQHKLTVEGTLKISDINSTVVTEPNLTGKNVNEVDGSEYFNMFSMASTMKVGKYESDIVEYKGNSYTYKGKRIFEITDVIDGVATGKFYEEYLPEYAPEKTLSFEFAGEIVNSNLEFTYEDNRTNETYIGTAFGGGYNNSMYINLFEIRTDGKIITHEFDQLENFDGQFRFIFK